MSTTAMLKLEGSKSKTMRMAKLCKATGFSMATVYRLMRIGLLHRPQQNGLKPVYDESHVKLLRRIKYLREEEKLSYSEIGILLRERHDDIENIEAKISIRNQIVNKGSQLFCQAGFQNTKISDITKALSISKGSFYLYFKDKRELLIECFDRVLFHIIPKEQWELIRNEKDPTLRLIKRVEVYFSVFPEFMGFIALLKSYFKSEDLDLKKKAHEAAVKIVTPVIKDIKWGLDNGVFKDIDPEFFAYSFIGIGEILGYRMMMDSKYSPSEIISFIKFLITNVLLIKKENYDSNQTKQTYTCILTDRNGIETTVENVLFNNKNYFSGKIGEAFVTMELGDIAFLCICEDTSLKAEVQMRNDDFATVVIEKEIYLTGKCSFGKYKVSLDKLSKIRFI